jgi:predicted nucleotidyltransferase
MPVTTPKLKIDLPMDEIDAFCRRWQITELSVFGSVLRDDFRPDSYVDFLVTFTPEARVSLFDLVEMQEELEDMIGREVDLLERVSIERSHYWIRRREVLGTAESIYVEG